jgi:colanic acid/amylovoran biosynthesis glycosyltransferase
VGAVTGYGGDEKDLGIRKWIECGSIDSAECAKLNLRVAYNTGEYPRVTDTFIQREVAALRQNGVDVVTCSIRQTGTKDHVGPEQLAAAARTFCVQSAAKSPLRLLASHCGEMLCSPKRYAAAAHLAWRLGWPGIKGRIWSLAYFLEAGVLARELRRRRVHHVHNHFGNSSCSVAAIAASMGGMTLSFTEHGPATFFEAPKWRLDLKVRQARFVACISEFARSQMMIFAHEEDWPKMKVVHCGIDPDLFQPRSHSNPARQVLFVGRLAAVKGLPVLIDAWETIAAEFPDVVLKLVGDGPDRSRLEQRVRDLGLGTRVVFVGSQSQAEVRSHLRDSDILAMSSFAEGLPVVLMEAFAAGVPVVATRIAGVSELVEDHRNGRLVPPGNAELLAAALVDLLSDAALRQRFGQAGRAKVEEEFNIGREAGKLIALFSGVCGCFKQAESPSELDRRGLLR